MRPIRLDPAKSASPALTPGIFSRPFFEDKNRAFWMLQGAGWTGYLLLRSLSTIAGDQPLKGLIGNVMEAIIGYCITLLLSTLYGLYRRRLPQVTGILLAIATLAAAMVTKNPAAAQSPAGPSPLVPMPNPAGTQMSATSGRTTASTAPVIPARAGAMLANERIQAGDSA